MTVRYETETVRIGEYVGPVDWDHPDAKDKPQMWRDAEANPSGYRILLNGMITECEIIEIGMYDGWPYWKPTPAILRNGPLGPEWLHFTSYGVTDGSIRPVKTPTPA